MWGLSKAWRRAEEDPGYLPATRKYHPMYWICWREKKKMKAALGILEARENSWRRQWILNSEAI